MANWYVETHKRRLLCLFILTEVADPVLWTLIREGPEVDTTCTWKPIKARKVVCNIFAHLHGPGIRTRDISAPCLEAHAYSMTRNEVVSQASVEQVVASLSHLTRLIPMESY